MRPCQQSGRLAVITLVGLATGCGDVARIGGRQAAREGAQEAAEGNGGTPRVVRASVEDLDRTFRAGKDRFEQTYGKDGIGHYLSKAQGGSPQIQVELTGSVCEFGPHPGDPGVHWARMIAANSPRRCTVTVLTKGELPDKLKQKDTTQTVRVVIQSASLRSEDGMVLIHARSVE